MPKDAAKRRLDELGLSWPLHNMEVDKESNREAHWSEPQELYVVFDDVSGHEFEKEIDALAKRLNSLLKVQAAERMDREYIMVAMRPGLPASLFRRSVDRTVSRFMRRAISKSTVSL